MAIIGGGPAGSTVGTILKKYSPGLKVGIFEREKFPRDHVGESLLPVISDVLAEMGVWDQVERAGFPVKIGATYRWGKTDELWDFEFLPDGKFVEEPRPAKYQGQRKKTAFQVDRSIYDKILLDQAAASGCSVFQQTAVSKVVTDGQRVDRLELNDGTQITARHNVDASGHSGLLRRAVGIAVECPTSLQNIAIWDYWQNAEWAVSVGVGGTRVQVLSQPYGWIWFIPLGPTRTSIGLIVPAKYYKEQPLSPEELYLRAVHSDPLVSKLIRNAHREERLSTTKDWSFVAGRLAGENWFLTGECAGFADPILAAGLSLAHIGARNLAYSILALDRGDFEPDWIKSYYSETHIGQIKQHIRFADFWYTANGVFSDLKDHAAEIAKDAGLRLTSDDAWRWLGQGGFIDRNSGTEFAQYGFLISKEIVGNFTEGKPSYEIAGKTHFKIDLSGAERDWVAEYREGHLTRFRAYRRGERLLPKRDLAGWLITELESERPATDLGRIALAYERKHGLGGRTQDEFWTEFIKTLEAMTSDGWVIARTVAGATAMPEPSVDFSQTIHPNQSQRPDPRP